MALLVEEILHALTFGRQAASGLYARPVAGEAKNELSDPQREAYDDIIRDLEKGNFGGFVERPTGTGKTILFGDVLHALQPMLAKKTQESGRRQGSLILVNTNHLANQTKQRFVDVCGIPEEDIAVYNSTAQATYKSTQRDKNPGALQSLMPKFDKPYLVMTYMAFISLVNKGLITPENRPVVVLDEADLSKGSTTSRMLKDFAEKSYVLGFTATERYLTPDGVLRSSSKDVLGRKDLIHRTTIAQAVENGEIAPVRGEEVRLDFASGAAADTYRDFTKEEEGEIAGNDARNHAAISAVAEKIPNPQDKQQLWYTSTIAQAKDVATALNARYGRGFAVAVDGETDEKTLENVFERFEKGTLKAIVSADLLIRGKDLPNAELAVCMRPNRSPTLTIQIAGRVMRKDRNNPDKEGIMLHVLNGDMQNIATFNALMDGSLYKKYAEREQALGEWVQPASGKARIPRNLLEFRVTFASLLNSHAFAHRKNGMVAELLNAQLEPDVTRVTYQNIAAWRNKTAEPGDARIVRAAAKIAGYDSDATKRLVSLWSRGVEQKKSGIQAASFASFHEYPLADSPVLSPTPPPIPPTTPPPVNDSFPALQEDIDAQNNARKIMSTTISQQDISRTLIIGSAIGHAKGSREDVRKAGLRHLARALEGKEENTAVTLPTEKKEAAFISDVLRSLSRMFDRKSDGPRAFRGSVILVGSEEEGQRLRNRLTRDHAVDTGAIAVYSQEEQTQFSARRKQRFTDHLPVDEALRAQTETLAPKFYKRHLIITRDDFARLSGSRLILPEQRPVVIVQGSQTPMSKREEDALQAFAQEGAQILRVGSEEVFERRAPLEPANHQKRFNSTLRELMRSGQYDHDDVAMFLNDRLDGSRVMKEQIKQWCKGNFQTLTDRHVELMAMMFRLTGDDRAEFIALGLQHATKTKGVPEEKKPSENEVSGSVEEDKGVAPRGESGMRISGDATAAFGGIIHMNVHHVGFPKFASQEELQRRFKTQLRQLILDSGKSNESIAMGTNDLADNRRIQQDWVREWRKKEGNTDRLTHKDIVRALARTLGLKEPALSDFVSLWEQATGRAPILLREENPVRVRKPRGPRGQKSDAAPEGATEEIVSSPSGTQSAPDESVEPESMVIFRRELAEILNTHVLFVSASNAEIAVFLNGEVRKNLVDDELIAQWRDGKGPLPEEAVIHALVAGCELKGDDRFLACYEAAAKRQPASPLPGVSDDRGEQAASPEEAVPVPPADERPTNGHSVPGTVIDATGSIVAETGVSIAPYLGMERFCDRNFAFFGKTDEDMAARINRRGDVVTAEDVGQWRAGQALPSDAALEAMRKENIIGKEKYPGFCADVKRWRGDAIPVREESSGRGNPMQANDAATRTGNFPGMQEFCDRSLAFFGNDDRQISERINKRLPAGDAISAQTVASWRTGDEIPSVPVAQALTAALKIAKPRGDAFIKNLKDWHASADARQSDGKSHSRHADAVRERRAAGYEAQR